jgi:PPP family 3-phenylpropionic acid transporter
VALVAWWLAAGLSLGLSREEGGRPAPILPALRALAVEPWLPAFLVALAIHGMALSVYDTLLALHVSRMGLPAVVTAACIAVGVGVEIVVMAFGRRLLSRWPPLVLFGAGTIVTVARFAATASVGDAVSLVLVQAAHGASFGLFWTASVDFLVARTPDRIRASAQAVLTATSYSVGPLLAGGATAFLLDRVGTTGMFGVAAGAAALATVFVAAAARKLRGRRPGERWAGRPAGG